MKLTHLYQWFVARPLCIALLLTAISSVLALLIATFVCNIELKRAIYTGAATLFFGAFLGGMLKLLLDDVAAGKRRREDAAGFVTNVLSDLKKVYDRVARAQILIPAHESAKTYGDEMRDLIDTRVQLRNVVRALETRADGIQEKTRQDVKGYVDLMGQYLETLIKEFRENYKRLSDKQRGYEAIADKFVAGIPEMPDNSELPELPKLVWNSIAALPQLSEFIKEDSEVYKSNFETPLDNASECLRNELASILT